MRTLTLALLLFAQAQTYPPPYPRAGTTKIMENDRVVVWDVSWLKQAYPVHRHVYDYAGEYNTSGDRIIVSEKGVRSPTTSVAWDTFGMSGKQRRDNDRVTIWELATAPGPRPPHLHARDAVIVSFTELKPHVTFVKRGTVHNDEQTTGADRVFAFEVK